MRLHCLKKFNFNYGLAISLLLHASFVLPFFLTTLHPPEQSKHERLSMELFGMISNRQMEERHKGAEDPQQPKTPQQMTNAAVQPSSEKYQTTAAASPVQVKKTDESVSERMPVPSASLPVDSRTSGAAVEQRQQSISYEAVKNAYMAMVAKRIQDNLAQELRANGAECKIAFTITSSGDISSLRVVKSSGDAAFDSTALKSARASAPFETPPEELHMVIGLSLDNG